MKANLGRLFVAATVVLAVGCGTDDGRPADAAWEPIWQEWRGSIPSADAFIERGEALCDPLVGQLRSSREDLFPTPAESLDAVVHAWLTDAESIAFDCPSDDPDVLRDRLHGLAVLAAEIDAGLAADQSSTRMPRVVVRSGGNPK